MDSNNILNSVIAAAYVQAAETEMIARQIEARIIATGGSHYYVNTASQSMQRQLDKT